MSEIKIGARALTDKELLLTLPTYKKIEEQMEQMRDTSRGSNDRSFQKTNNIGILGCRGAGKTSILHTLRKKIIEENNADIVLEIIIPENMSESSTLMENILGLLKVKVDEIEKLAIQKSRPNNCIKSNGKSLTQKYSDLIRTYTYIQKEYRDILISEFTSENEYVKKSKEVFNSDFEFQKNWKSFLEEILNPSSMSDGEENSNKPMIIVFIDDIDLSTYRCTDVVHTLLTYLSNSNIITFISGDIDTFEEALTLDFLRKEKALDADVFENTYYNGDSNLLERKRQLSYEYLKKVLPPMYRHQVKVWHLEERANYIIETSESPLSLKDLLLKKLNSYIPSYTFEYGEEEKRVLPYFFHMFDSTPRGLNNVYAVLQQMSSDHSSISKEDAYKEKKLLIETIISSNQLYNQKRSFLLEKVIQLGVDEENSHIDFGALREYYERTINDINIKIEEFKQLEREKTGKINGKKVKNRRNDLLLTIINEHFSFFVLTYFSAQMLLPAGHETFTNKDFCNAKNIAFNALSIQ